MPDGRLKQCKTCTTATQKDYIRRNADARREYERLRYHQPHRKENYKRYNQTEAGKAAHRKASKNNNEKFPEKRAARIAVNNAVRDGRLFKQPCSVCNDVKVEAHHDDYSKPLDVIWLCRTHHAERHRQLKMPM